MSKRSPLFRNAPRDRSRLERRAARGDKAAAEKVADEAARTLRRMVEEDDNPSMRSLWIAARLGHETAARIAPEILPGHFPLEPLDPTSPFVGEDYAKTLQYADNRILATWACDVVERAYSAARKLDPRSQPLITALEATEHAIKEIRDAIASSTSDDVGEFGRPIARRASLRLRAAENTVRQAGLDLLHADMDEGKTCGHQAIGVCAIAAGSAATVVRAWPDAWPDAWQTAAAAAGGAIESILDSSVPDLLVADVIEHGYEAFGRSPDRLPELRWARLRLATLILEPR